ncbi:hypothetical protein IFT80_03550 [Pseudomonas sp. CFBP 8771]|uniref:hypothetical protein n=1 Tax=Pseudomonas sp. CFBP 8771 TaxID=2775285 RepID=UPI001784764E|nr:hypothetical protein [Pseudomonas sp. CFBP 8771]MBD8601715.1 hypothetical protein [Pseudomonas sp. CFBP 8771]
MSLTDRSARLAATDRSYVRWTAPVGAVIGRERLIAMCLTDRSARFAATDRSYEYRAWIVGKKKPPH